LRQRVKIDMAKAILHDAASSPCWVGSSNKDERTMRPTGALHLAPVSYHKPLIQRNAKSKTAAAGIRLYNNVVGQAF